jgi:hypothetical protein
MKFKSFYGLKTFRRYHETGEQVTAYFLITAQTELKFIEPTQNTPVMQCEIRDENSQIATGERVSRESRDVTGVWFKWKRCYVIFRRLWKVKTRKKMNGLEHVLREWVRHDGGQWLVCKMRLRCSKEDSKIPERGDFRCVGEFAGRKGVICMWEEMGDRAHDSSHR